MYRLIDNLPGTTYDAVVLGGGFAGATAARGLTQAGLSVLVVEARSRLGGRMWSELNHFEEYPVEYGGAFMLDRQWFPLAWEEIEAAGVPLEWGSEEEAELVWVTAGERRTGALPVPLAELGSLERLIVRINALADRIDADVPVATLDLDGLDRPWPDLISDLELGPHTVDLWRSYIETHTFEDWTVCSALPLLVGIAQAGSLADASFLSGRYNTAMARSLGPQLALGTGSLHDAIMSQTDAEVILNCVVDVVAQDGQKVVVSTDRGRITARAAVCALPIGVLSSVDFEPPLPPALTRLAEEGVAGHAAKATIYVSNCPRPFWGHGTPSGGGFATAATTFHEGDRGVVVGFTPRQDALDLDDLAAVEAALQWYMPGIRVDALSWHDWASDPFSRGAFSYLRPGQMSVRQTARDPHGLIVFAGSDFDARLGVEGALYTGRIAAEEALAMVRARVEG